MGVQSVQRAMISYDVPVPVNYIDETAWFLTNTLPLPVGDGQ
jgi:hypothetical protein